MKYKYKNKQPKVADSSFIAPGARVVGEVELREETSIWYNASLRADLNKMILKEGSNIQENSALHVDTEYPLLIGKNVTVGHNATIHGCIIKNNCLIGMGAIILNNALINENSIIAAGSLVTEGKEFPPGSLIMGSPAKVVRELSKEEIKGIKDSAKHYIKLGREHKKSLKSTTPPKS
ncbi:MAG: gamma carbonic anhydrase family protein [Halanaerobiales bacterium]|nr:gamma carbonic anhydrase family protein [Halanaerobiales bacterium]